MLPDNPPKATVDFETRSAVELLDTGAWVYSLHPTTGVLCFVYRLPYWEEDRTELWHPAFPELGIEEAPLPVELFNWLASGGLIEAHNSFFERSIWLNQMVAKFNWPEVPHKAWRCSAAKAAVFALPRGLEGLCKVLKTRHQKDKVGSKTMLKMAKPRKLLKKERKALEAQGIDPDGQLWWHETYEMLEVLFAYCRTDVLAEEEASSLLRDLSAEETDVFLMDQWINQRGVQIDQAAVETALELVGGIYTELNAELIQVVQESGSEIEITKATQRARILAWLNEQGVPIMDTQGPTVDEWLKRKDLKPSALRMLELMRALGRSSTAKYVAMQEWSDPRDGRARGMLLYHGAGTGRWSGAGPQPHNFPRGDIKNMSLAWDAIHTKDILLIETLYEDLMTVLSHALRGAIIPSPGKELIAADYAAIEARVIFWLADDQAALDIFRRGDCIYCDMATDIYKRVITKANFNERQMGKQTILGLGFQMGWKKFIDTCAKYGIFLEPEFAQYVVNLYRSKYWRVKKMWSDQEQAAIEAIRSGRQIRCGRIVWKVIDRFLHCKLPSGRVLSYCDPVLIKKPMPWDKNDLRDAISFMGVDPQTKQWRRTDTYGGTLVENIVQATARDLMADAMLRCEKTGVYDVVLSVHDELITEVVKGKGSVKELETLMSIVPAWADGCPVKAEGWAGLRYKK